jgi:hypothetical protein
MAMILVAESGSGSQAGEPMLRTGDWSILMIRTYRLNGPV